MQLSKSRTVNAALSIRMTGILEFKKLPCPQIISGFEANNQICLIKGPPHIFLGQGGPLLKLLTYKLLGPRKRLCPSVCLLAFRKSESRCFLYEVLWVALCQPIIESGFTGIWNYLLGKT